MICIIKTDSQEIKNGKISQHILQHTFVNACSSIFCSWDYLITHKHKISIIITTCFTTWLQHNDQKMSSEVISTDTRIEGDGIRFSVLLSANWIKNNIPEKVSNISYLINT